MCFTSSLYSRTQKGRVWQPILPPIRVSRGSFSFLPSWSGLGFVPLQDRFSIPYYHIINNNTQGRILHYFEWCGTEKQQLILLSYNGRFLCRPLKNRAKSLYTTKKNIEIKTQLRCDRRGQNIPQRVL